MIRILRVLLATGVASSLAFGDGNPGVLEIRVAEGADAVYAVGSRATRGVTVFVNDEAGHPVEGATVSFSLPAGGPGGVFASGARTEIATSSADGRAAAWGMRWNNTAGPFSIRIAAMKGQARGSATVAQSLSDAPELKVETPRGSGGRKLLWIALAGGAVAAAAGVAGRSAPGQSTAAAPAAVSGVQIGAPSITVGRP